MGATVGCLVFGEKGSLGQLAWMNSYEILGIYRTREYAWGLDKWKGDR